MEGILSSPWSPLVPALKRPLQDGRLLGTITVSASLTSGAYPWCSLCFNAARGRRDHEPGFTTPGRVTAPDSHLAGQVLCSGDFGAKPQHFPITTCLNFGSGSTRHTATAWKDRRFRTHGSPRRCLPEYVTWKASLSLLWQLK